jgi:PAS domain S-box-containing protein
MPHRKREFHILLIEDNPGDARLIREMLLNRPERVHLTVGSSLREGMAHLQNGAACDAILLDLLLPDSQGLDTIRRIRPEAPNAPIIVLTGNNDDELGSLAVQDGAQDYLPKDDVDGKLLIRSIRYAIARHQVDQELRRSDQQYRSLIDDVFDTSMVAVIILDNAFNVVWCNEATEIYFGVKREHLLGKDKRRLIDEELKCVFADPDDYAQRLLNAYTEGVFTKRFECHVVPGSVRDERWLEHWSQPIRDGMYAGGRIEQYTDITDRKMLEFAEREQRQFAEALTSIGTLLTGSLNLDEVLGRILGNVGRVVPHDSASITMLEDNRLRIARYRSDSRISAGDDVAEKRLQMEYSRYLNVLFANRQPVIVPDLQLDERIQVLALEANLHAYLGVPILLQNEVIGFVNLFSEKVHHYQQIHAERLSAFAELAAIAIQNARLYGQSQQLAALEERQRLARELHDSVSQTLFTCRAMAESALRRWDKDPPRAHELMQSAYQLATTALAEMRVLLLELRPAALTQISLKQLFEQYLHTVQERRQLNLNLVLDEIAPLPPEVQIALYRITQEALNNIDKHAQAKQVEVRVTDYPEHIELTIHDDGTGFQPDKVAATSLGLGIMRERAEQISADLELVSQPGAGTRITVIWHK